MLRPVGLSSKVQLVPEQVVCGSIHNRSSSHMAPSLQSSSNLIPRDCRALRLCAKIFPSVGEVEMFRALCCRSWLCKSREVSWLGRRACSRDSWAGRAGRRTWPNQICLRTRQVGLVCRDRGSASAWAMQELKTKSMSQTTNRQSSVTL